MGVNWGVRNAGKQHWGTNRRGRRNRRHRHRQAHHRVTLMKSVKAVRQRPKALFVAYAAYHSGFA
ncbi:hypothetical protein AB0C38_49255, partial [Amycolatopsis sp. NPDC048633]|uniref:hypothetical protein n=1 Tax=Amycolatopsis sp. NPDC048633 TaxID=3157095 RepID=UPI0033DF28D2